MTVFAGSLEVIVSHPEGTPQPGSTGHAEIHRAGTYDSYVLTLDNRGVLELPSAGGVQYYYLVNVRPEQDGRWLKITERKPEGPEPTHYEGRTSVGLLDHLLGIDFRLHRHAAAADACRTRGERPEGEPYIHRVELAGVSLDRMCDLLNAYHEEAGSRCRL